MTTHRGSANLLDARGAFLVALVALPAGIALCALLRPWAAALDPADFTTAEGVAAGPILAALFLVLAVAYRPLLATSIIERREMYEVRLGATWVGLGVWSAPVVVGLFAPLFVAGRLVPTLALGGSLALAEMVSLERQRRGADARRLRWRNEGLEANRLLWTVAGAAAVLAVGWVSLGATPGGP